MVDVAFGMVHKLGICAPTQIHVGGGAEPASCEVAHTNNFFKVWEYPEWKDRFRWIDEPTNEFYAEARWDQWAAGAALFHPKLTLRTSNLGEVAIRRRHFLLQPYLDRVVPLTPWLSYRLGAGIGPNLGYAATSAGDGDYALIGASATLRNRLSARAGPVEASLVLDFTQGLLRYDLPGAGRAWQSTSMVTTGLQLGLVL